MKLDCIYYNGSIAFLSYFIYYYTFLMWLLNTDLTVKWLFLVTIWGICLVYKITRFQIIYLVSWSSINFWRNLILYFHVVRLLLCVSCSLSLWRYSELKQQVSKIILDISYLKTKLKHSHYCVVSPNLNYYQLLFYDYLISIRVWLN